jgi:hypothetical protein
VVEGMEKGKIEVVLVVVE